MHRVTYYCGGYHDIHYKDFETLKQATDFAINLPIESVLEINYYENSVNNGPTFWSEE